MKAPSLFIVLLFFFSFLLFMPSTSFAHKLSADVLVADDGKALLDAFFGDGSPARKVTVEIHRPDGSTFCKGNTDETGRYVFAPSGPPGTWKAVIQSSLGHRAETTFVWKNRNAGPPGDPFHKDKPSPPANRNRKGETGVWIKLLAGLGFITGFFSLILSCFLYKEWKKLRDGLSGN